MIKILSRTLCLISILCIINSCSSELEDDQKSSEGLVTDYTYSSNELEMMELINNYRISIGLNSLERINHISFKSEEHNNYMITNNIVSHDNFVSRSDNIIKVLGAKKVNENIGYNYKTPQGVLGAWLNSSDHKKNIEGDFTNFGISIRENADNGKKYYTNIFVKL